MPVKFDFLSPEVLLREVDQSQVPAETAQDGILIIGTAPAGPAMKPVRVRDLQSFLDIFGNPSTGKAGSDLWRNGSMGPTYGMYAAQAWLSAESSPVTFVRLAGEQDPIHTTGGLLAGWSTALGMTTARDTNGGSYGLWIAASSSLADNPVTGTLAAVIYVEKGSLRLKGTSYTHGLAGSAHSHAGVIVKSIAGEGGQFEILHHNNTKETSYVVNFNKSASNTNSNYIRNVIPTNPQKTNSTLYSSPSELFLGETFEEMVDRKVLQTKSAAEEQYGILVHMGGASAATNWPHYQDHRQQARAPKSGWFVSQDFGADASFVGANLPKLFRVNGLHEGEWLQKNYQIGIEIQRLGNNVNPYGTFHLYVMDMQNNLVEQFKNLNFNPGSENFITKRIGDQNQEWDADQKKYRVLGEYANRSDYIWIELAESVKNGSMTSLGSLPFGVQGPIVYSPFKAEQGNADVLAVDGGAYAFGASMEWHENTLIDGYGGTIGSECWGHTVNGTKTAFEWPKLRLTTTNASGSSSTNYAASAWLGVDHHISGSTSFDESYYDLVRSNPSDGTFELSQHIAEDGSLGDNTEFSYIFTLDEVKRETNGLVHYVAGSRADSTSITGAGSADTLINTRRVRKFKSPMFGGADGTNIKEANPFANHSGVLGDGTNNLESTNYAIYSVMKALDTVADSEIVSYDLLSIPGVTNTKITDRVLEICSDRGDALGIIDLADGFQAAQVESTANVNGSVSTTISTLVGRDINTSYGAAYYPWVRLRDTISGNGDVIMAPPSVAAIGAIARSEAVSEPWFAPAGFNRGGIRQLGGAKGPQVVGTWEHLTKDNRDDLYAANINPIARFPAINEIVIFGQKTLQQTPSALDRINVRRLMIFLKKAIKNIADTILFDQNVNTTWLRFRAEADRVLSSVQTRLGVTEYKIVLDNTTTTPDLIDRNILYAKIFVKPARSIEFIAVDFIITRSGVEF